MKLRPLVLSAAVLAIGGAIHAGAAEKRSTRTLDKKPAESNPDWQIVKYEGRDYLTLNNIARFYKLHGEIKPGEKRVFLTNGRTSLETGLDGRIMIINGVKQWMSFP